MFSEKPVASTHLDPQAAAVLQTMLDAQPHPALLVDDAHRILLVNPATCELLGVEAAALVDQPCPQEFHHLASGVAGCPLDACLACGAPWGEARMRLGEREFMSSVFRTALHTDDGHQVVLHTLLKITQQRHTERSLARREQQLQTIIDAIPRGLVHVFDRKLRFVFNAGEELGRLGLSNEGLVGKSIFEVLPPDTARLCAEHYARVLQGETVRFEGGYADELFMVTAAPLRNPAGEVEQILALSINVTEQRRTEEQLRQTQRLEAVGKLAAGVAHDFNNLLTVINNCADLALDRMPPDDPLQPDLVQIRQAGARAASLTRQLLAFGRCQTLKPELLDLNAVVANLDAMLRRLLGEDIVLRTRLATGLPRCQVDTSQLEQVIVNLAINARDAMPGGGCLTLQTGVGELDADYAAQHEGVTAGRHVLLAVSDTGVGMDAATRARVFEPFFSTKPRDKAAGLGLSTVYGIVKQSQGHVAVYSEPGQGSIFKVYLPAVAAEGETARAQGPHPGLATGHETILLVEDDELVRRTARRILDKAGYRVIEAAEGAQALALCRLDPGSVQLVLTDVVMPGLGGRQLAEQLAASYPGLKVVFMSGYTDDAVVQRGGLEASVRFVHKPFSAAELTRAVREALDE